MFRGVINLLRLSNSSEIYETRSTENSKNV